MKATELRIGNWVTYQGSEVVRVRKTEHNRGNPYIGAKHENGITEYWNVQDAFLPIPLTKEWLKRFGFEWSKYEKQYYKFFKEETPIDHLASNQLSVTIISENIKYFCAVNSWNHDSKEWDGMHLINQSPQYVHQLQNLYHALTGEDLCEDASTPV